MFEFSIDHDHHREAERIRRRILRDMTPVQRLDAAMDMFWVARAQKSAAVQREHPDWTHEQVQRAVHEAILYARD